MLTEQIAKKIPSSFVTRFIFHVSKFGNLKWHRPVSSPTGRHLQTRWYAGQDEFIWHGDSTGCSQLYPGSVYGTLVSMLVVSCNISKPLEPRKSINKWRVKTGEQACREIGLDTARLEDIAKSRNYHQTELFFIHQLCVTSYFIVNCTVSLTDLEVLQSRSTIHILESRSQSFRRVWQVK